MNQPHFIHPETKQDEVFITNTDSKGFKMMSWSSKRRGSIPYDGDGNTINSIDWFPVFINKDFLIQSGKSLQSLRSHWQSQFEASLT